MKERKLLPGLEEEPEFMFLSETKQEFNFLQNLQFCFEYNKLYTVEPCGASGGLALFYNNDFQVTILFANNRIIDTQMIIQKDGLYIICLWRPGTKI